MSIREQISNKCIFFNGMLRNSKCAANIPYEEVRFDKPFKLPCLSQGGTCDKRKFLTKEEIDAEVKKIEDISLSSISAYSLIQNHIVSTKERSGVVKCNCGGDLSFVVSSSNNHISFSCDKCGISGIE